MTTMGFDDADELLEALRGDIRKPPKRIGPREVDLETWARSHIAGSGGLILKWTCPGRKGMPDDLILWHRPYARRAYRKIVHFAEFKILDEQPDVSQQIAHDLLRKHGAFIFIPRTREDVLNYVAKWRP